MCPGCREGGRRLLGGSRRWPRAGGSRGGRERRLRAGVWQKFGRVSARDSLPRRAGEGPAVTPRLQPAAPGPGPSSRGAENRPGRTKGRERQKFRKSKKSVAVSAARKPRWKAIAPRLGELLCWARGALGAWARGQKRLGGAQGGGGFPARPRNRGPGGRESDSALAGRACCPVIFPRDTRLVPGFAFYKQLARCTEQHLSHLTFGRNIS